MRSHQTVPYEDGAGAPPDGAVTPPGEGNMFRLEQIQEIFMMIALVLDVLLLKSRHQKRF